MHTENAQVKKKRTRKTERNSFFRTGSVTEVGGEKKRTRKTERNSVFRTGSVTDVGGEKINGHEKRNGIPFSELGICGDIVV